MDSAQALSDIDPHHVLDVNPNAVLRNDSCHVCDARHGDGRKLQKCAGCNIAIYCSKACQKSAWKSHRYVCRQTDSTKAIHDALEEKVRREQAERPGPRRPFAPGASEVPLAGLAGFNLFEKMHDWAITTMCQALVHLLNDGRGAESFRRDPVVMRFEVHPSKDARAKPWNAYTLRQWRHRSLDDFLKDDAESFAKTWEGMRAVREAREAQHRAEYGSRFIGDMPVIFYIENTHASSVAMIPILKLREPDAMQDRRARGAVEDLLNLCLGYTNKGVPLGQLKVAGLEALAFPGRNVKFKPDGAASGKKEWGWTLRTPEDPWGDFDVGVFKRMGRRTDLTPTELMLLFYDMTAERPSRGIATGPS